MDLRTTASPPSAARGSRHAATAVAASAAVSAQTSALAPHVPSTNPPAMLATMNATDPHSRTGP